MHRRKALNIATTILGLLWLSFPFRSMGAATKEDLKTTLSVRAARSSAVYHQGEVVRFEVHASTFSTLGTNAEVQWKLSKDGVAPVLTGTVPLVDGRAVISGNLEEPGHLLCTVSLQLEGKLVTALAGAAIDPLLIKPSMSAPDDFDAFWNAQKKKLAAIPLAPRLKTVSSSDTNVQCFDAQVDCAGTAPVSGYLARPSGAKARSLPAILLLHGAGVGSSSLGNAAGWAARGFLAFDMNAHGLPNGQSLQFYKDLDQGALRGYSHKGRESRETSYFLGMFLRMLRGVDFLAAQPEWDGKVLVAYGSSQGGFQAIAAGGLDERVSFIAAGVPAGCDHTGMVANRVSGWPKWVPVDANQKPAPEALNASRYFDAVNFAARTKAAGAFFTVGFIDQVCPPTSVYAAYNNLPVPKQIYNDIPTAHANSSAATAARNKAVSNHAVAKRETVLQMTDPAHLSASR